MIFWLTGCLVCELSSSVHFYDYSAVGIGGTILSFFQFLELG